MKRVLFVDDDPNILSGLRRMLRSMRHEWEMDFQESGQAGLDAMAENPFDIVVSDMKMPGMDGAEFLQRVKEKFPETTRFVLSGHAEREVILKSVGPTHQYLSKPCDPEVLKKAIERSGLLRGILQDDQLKGLVASMTSLPSMPDLFRKIVEMVQDPDVSLERIGQVISQDVGMSANILKVVNSAFFGANRHFTNISHAVSFLGLETINSLVLGTELFSQFEGSAVPQRYIDSLWHHSMECAMGARAVALAAGLDKDAGDDAFMAGVLHDAGQIVLAINETERFNRVLDRVRNGEVDHLIAEREEFGVTHAEVGAYLIGLWGLSDSIVAAIAYHHDPISSTAMGVEPLTAVHLSNVVARHSEATEAETAALLQVEYLNTQGGPDNWKQWRQKCLKTICEGASQ